ncbi:MAG: hypothetical protein ACXVKA_13100 [Acidimicrobiia bacterium]
MSQEQNPLERAVDLFVFAPIGVAMFAKDTVPTFLKMFVSRGQTELARQKKSLHDQANQYRAVGRFAVRYGGPEVRRHAEGKLDGARRLAEETFSGLVVGRSGGGAGESPPAPTPRPKAAGREEPVKARTRTEVAANGAAYGKSAAKKNGNGAAASHEAPALAIPEYDQLSASQVVERLEGLTAGELDAVRAYELAHRGRNTILGKIIQLTG